MLVLNFWFYLQIGGERLSMADINSSNVLLRLIFIELFYCATQFIMNLYIFILLIIK